MKKLVPLAVIDDLKHFFHVSSLLLDEKSSLSSLSESASATSIRALDSCSAQIWLVWAALSSSEHTFRQDVTKLRVGKHLALGSGRTVASYYLLLCETPSFFPVKTEQARERLKSSGHDRLTDIDTVLLRL